MKPSEVAQALTICLDAKQTVVLWGSSGIGKSNIIHQVGQATGRDVRDVRAVLLDPVDLRGLPHINSDGRSHWAIPEFLPRDGQGILFLDELNRAPALVQNACFQLVLDRKLGEYTLPDGWTVAAACNRESDGGGITKMSSALCNRFVHLDCEPDLDDWCKWAIRSNIEPAVIAFLRFRPELLHKFDRVEKAFPSPRSWEFVSRITGKQAPKSVEFELFKGTVGQGAAVEFYGFLSMFRNLPSIDAILMNPTSATVPVNDIGSMYAIASALARRCEVTNIRRVIQYLDRMPQEFAVMAVKDAVGRNSALSATDEFTKWAIEHSDVVF